MTPNIYGRYVPAASILQTQKDDTETRLINILAPGYVLTEGVKHMFSNLAYVKSHEWFVSSASLPNMCSWMNSINMDRYCKH